MAGIVDRVGTWLRSLFPPAGPAGGGAAGDDAAWAFASRVMRDHHFTQGAQQWLRANVKLRVDDFSSTRGGGYWQPQSREVHLFTAQDEAAVHELAHAWWHYRRESRKEEMIEATVRLSAEPDSRYRRMQSLAFGYVHGIPEQNWPGMLVENNDWEMFAGLASGSMGDMSLLPRYVRRLYEGLFQMPDMPDPGQA